VRPEPALRGLDREQYIGSGVPLEDLINEGNVGLIRAAKRFDVERGYRFISYAVWWVKQAILQYLGEQSRTVPPAAQQDHGADAHHARVAAPGPGAGPRSDRGKLAKRMSITPQEVERCSTCR
jgi:RNA polymerase sigma factor (sigma-70 family)